MTATRRGAGARGVLALATAGLLALSWSAPAAGQTPDMRTVTYTGAGYSGNLPDVLTGVGVFHVMGGRGLGLFANGHMTFDSPADDPFFIEGRTPTEAANEGHIGAVREREVFRSASIGLIRPFDPELALYAGIGFTRQRVYEEWEDEEREIGGEFGHYWVEDPGEERDGVNFTAGLFVQAGRHLFFRIGGETFPLGGSLGVYWALPR